MRLKKEYSRSGPNKFRPCTVNITSSNYDKLKNSGIYFSKLVNDFISENDKKTLSTNYPKTLRYSFKGVDRVVSSVSIDYNLIGKIDKINLSYLVNHLIEKYIK